MTQSNPIPSETRPETTLRVYRGACLHLAAHNYDWVPEFTVKTGRRIDAMGLSPKGHFWAIEVKSSLEDFRVDQKWPEYLAFCDQFSFAVSPDFPCDALPEEVGIIISDGFEHYQRRKPLKTKGLSSAARKSLLVRFGRVAATRAFRASQELLSLGQVLDLETDS